MAQRGEVSLGLENGNYYYCYIIIIIIIIIAETPQIYLLRTTVLLFRASACGNRWTSTAYSDNSRDSADE